MCRPLYEVPIESESDQSSTSATTPATIAPAIAPNSVAPTPPPVPGKVQKAGRRQSNIQAAPENIARALESMENQNSENGAVKKLPSQSSHNQVLSAMYGPLGQQPPALVHNRVFDESGNLKPPRSGGCCSDKASIKPPPEQPQRQGSCCGTQESHSEQDTSANTGLRENESAHPSTVNGTPYTPFSAPPAFSPWQDYNTAGHVSLLQPFPVHQTQAQASAYLPPYALPSTMGFPYQNLSHNIGFAQADMSAYPAAQFQNIPYTPPTAIEGDSGHVCKCGDGCQCLGCASHPFNNTTKQHVQEMGLLVGLNGEQSQHSQYPASATYPIGTNDNLENGVQHDTIHTYSEHTPYSDHMGSGYPSHANYTPDQDLMEPSQYYTLEYSVGLPNPCSDVTGSCQCGNDCSCIGCLTHSGHNNLGLEPVSTENTGFLASGQSPQRTGSNGLRDYSAPSPSL